MKPNDTDTTTKPYFDTSLENDTETDNYNQNYLLIVHISDMTLKRLNIIEEEAEL